MRLRNALQLITIVIQLYYVKVNFVQVLELALAAEQLSQERFQIEALKEMEEENISNKLQRQIEYLVGYVKVCHLAKE